LKKEISKAKWSSLPQQDLSHKPNISTREWGWHPRARAAVTIHLKREAVEITQLFRAHYNVHLMEDKRDSSQRAACLKH
jgi:hypothetical protein